MQTLTTALLVYGILFIGYSSQLLSYFLLRRKAHRASGAGRSITQVPWWRLICQILCAELVVGAIIWTVVIAHQFAHLIPAWLKMCPSLIPADDCGRVAFDWKANSEGIVECALGALFIISCMAYAEATSTAAPPERSCPVTLLTWSHCLLLLSWLLCTPLIYPLALFNLIAKTNWATLTSASTSIATVAYIIGTALWIIALVRICCAWWYQRGRASTEGQEPRESDRDIVLQDFSNGGVFSVESHIYTAERVHE